MTALLLFLYRLGGALGRPFIDLHLTVRQWRGKEEAARLPERHGRASRSRPDGKLIWLHAASVGEALSILMLIENLARRWPDLNLLVTTGTRSSARLMQERLPYDVVHQYLPLDIHDWINRFYNHWRPDLGFIVESELWPNLLDEARRREIPMVLLNARMSKRSFGRWKLIRSLATHLVGSFHLVLAQNRVAEDRFAALGARRHACLGNLKFAATPLATDRDLLAETEAALAGRPRWLAASTHKGEEEILGEVHKTLKSHHNDILTIIVPRHPERGDRIEKTLSAQGFQVARRSAGQGPDAAGDIYIADTLGELGLWYRVSELVFIGRSLVPKGGQNPIEPARLNCTLLYGPHDANFREITQAMIDAKALQKVRNAEDLANHLLVLLEDSALRSDFARHAKDYANSQNEVLSKVLEEVSPLIAALPNRPN